jgi:hypothetical protein
MSRPYPNRRRKCPGRRPPHRYRGGGPPVRPGGFQAFGFRHIYDLVLPGIRGRDRRRFLNQCGAWGVLAMGLTVAIVGSSESGFTVAILGGVAAAVLMGRGLKKHGFYRP